MGKEDVEGTECFKLVVTFKSGKTKTLYLDPQSYLTIREKETVKANGQEMKMPLVIDSQSETTMTK